MFGATQGRPRIDTQTSLALLKERLSSILSKMLLQICIRTAVCAPWSCGLIQDLYEGFVTSHDNTNPYTQLASQGLLVTTCQTVSIAWTGLIEELTSRPSNGRSLPGQHKHDPAVTRLWDNGAYMLRAVVNRFMPRPKFLPFVEVRFNLSMMTFEY